MLRKIRYSRSVMRLWVLLHPRRVRLMNQVIRDLHPVLERLVDDRPLPPLCPAVSPETGTPCGLADAAEQHDRGHERRLSDTLIASWSTRPEDYARWERAALAGWPPPIGFGQREMPSPEALDRVRRRRINRLGGDVEGNT